MLVEWVMTRAVVTTEPSRSVHSAALLMREGRFRHLPVLVRDRLVGIVSDRDVTVGHEHRTVADVMRTDVICVAPDTPIEVATRLMLDNQIGALPVVANGTSPSKPETRLAASKMSTSGLVANAIPDRRSRKRSPV